MTLDQIKRHAFFPFRDFKTNDLAFLLLELYWAELFKSILTEAGDPGLLDWKPQSPADRTDGNPIFHVIDRSLQPARALRIIQRFNGENLAELNLENPSPLRFTGDAYVPFVPGLTYGALDQDGATPIEELVISSDISEPCEQLNRQMILRWCAERVLVAQMQREINDYWKMVEANLIEVPPDLG